jgi:long-subunit acyl-CoA synthetase (AMP-forming)
MDFLLYRYTLTHQQIVDPETGKILGPNAEGELCFKTRGMLLRYRRNPEATEALFDEDGFLHSGDIAYYDEDRYFYIVDRIKDLIKYKLNHVSAILLLAKFQHSSYYQTAITIVSQ